MPIWLRKFTFNRIQKYYTDKSEQNKTPSKTKTELPKGPNISPSYTTKASNN